MKNIILKTAGVTAILGLLFLIAQTNTSAAQNKNDDSRKIIVFKAGLNDAAKDAIIERAGGVKLKNLNRINAKAVYLSSRAMTEALKANPDVARVDDDVIVEALGYKAEVSGKISTQAAQVLPWGIDRIDAELVWPGGNTADSVKVGIIDTGISNSHPDLAANVKGGVNTINPRKSWNDDNGHGSHVAGIVAALNNTVGVVGVGPKADLYAIKALNTNGSGYLSDIIEGIQWAVDNQTQVINMSLGTSSNIQSFHDAVIAARNAGVVIVAAAGNS